MGRSRGRQLIAGLDVGTTKICCVIAEWSSIGTVDIVGVGTSPSRGLRKGVVVNIDSTAESIKQAVGDAGDMVGGGGRPSRGLRKGVVVNIDSTVESIKQAVGDAEDMAGVEIASVIAGVA